MDDDIELTIPFLLLLLTTFLFERTQIGESGKVDDDIDLPNPFLQESESLQNNWGELWVDKTFSTIGHDIFSFLKSTLVKHETGAPFSGLEHGNLGTFSNFEHETIDLVGHGLFSFEFSTVEEENWDLFGLDILLTFTLYTLNGLLLY